MSKLTPSVYVGTYNKYNNGSLKGEWVDIDDYSDYEEFMEHLRSVHSDETDPEFMIQDYEGYPGCWYYEGGLGESTFDKIKQFSELAEDEQEAVMAYGELDEVDDIDEVLEKFCGKFDSEEDYAETLIDECYEVPEALSNWIDYGKVARDIFIDDYVFIDGFVFHR